MSGNKVQQELAKLANLKLTSPFLHKTTQNILQSSFSSAKPIFSTEQDKNQATSFLIKSIPAIEKSLSILHGSLSPERREVAQRARSGLQYLAEEFKEIEDVQNLLKSSPVHCIEEYIKNSKEFASESDTKHINFNNIPKTHFWWYL